MADVEITEAGRWRRGARPPVLRERRSRALHGKRPFPRDTERAMSQENVGIVLRVYDALNQRDWDAVFRDFDQEAEVTMQRGPGAGTHRRREVQGVLQDYVETF